MLNGKQLDEGRLFEYGVCPASFTLLCTELACSLPAAQYCSSGCNPKCGGKGPPLALSALALLGLDTPKASSQTAPQGIAMGKHLEKISSRADDSDAIDYFRILAGSASARANKLVSTYLLFQDSIRPLALTVPLVVFTPAATSERIKCSASSGLKTDEAHNCRETRALAGHAPAHTMAVSLSVMTVGCPARGPGQLGPLCASMRVSGAGVNSTSDGPWDNRERSGDQAQRRGTAACTADSSHTRQQNGVSGRQHAGTLFANQRQVTHSPAGGPANRETVAASSSQKLRALIIPWRRDKREQIASQEQVRRVAPNTGSHYCGLLSHQRITSPLTATAEIALWGLAAVQSHNVVMVNNNSFIHVRPCLHSAVPVDVDVSETRRQLRTQLRTKVQFSDCFNLGHMLTLDTAAWDSAITSEDHVQQSKRPCPKTQYGAQQDQVKRKTSESAKCIMADGQAPLGRAVFHRASRSTEADLAARSATCSVDKRTAGTHYRRNYYAEEVPPPPLFFFNPPVYQELFSATNARTSTASSFLSSRLAVFLQVHYVYYRKRHKSSARDWHTLSASANNTRCDFCGYPHVGGRVCVLDRRHNERSPAKRVGSFSLRSKQVDLSPGREKREIPDKTRRSTASSDTILTFENPVTRPGIEPGSSRWEARVLTAQPPGPLSNDRCTTVVMDWIPRYLKRSRGRPPDRWDRDIRRVVCVNWKNIAQDRLAWNELETTYMMLDCRVNVDKRARRRHWRTIKAVHDKVSTFEINLRKTAVAERLARSPPTKANRVQSPTGPPDFRWSAGFLGDLQFPRPFIPGPLHTPIALIVSQDLAPIPHLRSKHRSPARNSANKESFAARSGQSYTRSVPEPRTDQLANGYINGTAAYRRPMAGVKQAYTTSWSLACSRKITRVLHVPTIQQVCLGGVACYLLSRANRDFPSKNVLLLTTTTKYQRDLLNTPRRRERHDGNTAHLARRSDEALGVRVSVARIAPSLLDLEREESSSHPECGTRGRWPEHSYNDNRKHSILKNRMWREPRYTLVARVCNYARATPVTGDIHMEHYASHSRGGRGRGRCQGGRAATCDCMICCADSSQTQYASLETPVENIFTPFLQQIFRPKPFRTINMWLSLMLCVVIGPVPFLVFLRHFGEQQQTSGHTIRSSSFGFLRGPASAPSAFFRAEPVLPIAPVRVVTAADLQLEIKRSLSGGSFLWCVRWGFHNVADKILPRRKLRSGQAHEKIAGAGAAVAERLACPPPTTANRVQSPAGPLPDFRSGNRAGRCRLSAGFLRDLPFPPVPFSPHFTIIGSQDLVNIRHISQLNSARKPWSKGDVKCQGRGGRTPARNNTPQCARHDGQLPMKYKIDRHKPDRFCLPTSNFGLEMISILCRVVRHETQNVTTLKNEIVLQAFLTMKRKTTGYNHLENSSAHYPQIEDRQAEKKTSPDVWSVPRQSRLVRPLVVAAHAPVHPLSPSRSAPSQDTQLNLILPCFAATPRRCTATRQLKRETFPCSSLAEHKEKHLSYALMPGCTNIFPDPRSNDLSSEPGFSLILVPFLCCTNEIARFCISDSSISVPNRRGHGAVVVTLLASHQGEMGSIFDGVAPGFSHAGNVPDNAAGRRVFSGSPVPPPLHHGAGPHSPRLTLIDSQNLNVKSRPNIFTHSPLADHTDTHESQIQNHYLDPAILHDTRFRKSLCKVSHNAGIRASVAPAMAFPGLYGQTPGHVLFFAAGSTPALVPGQSYSSFRARQHTRIQVTNGRRCNVSLYAQKQERSELVALCCGGVRIRTAAWRLGLTGWHADTVTRTTRRRTGARKRWARGPAAPKHSAWEPRPTRTRSCAGAPAARLVKLSLHEAEEYPESRTLAGLQKRTKIPVVKRLRTQDPTRLPVVCLVEQGRSRDDQRCHSNAVRDSDGSASLGKAFGLKGAWPKDYSPPTKANLVQIPDGSLRIFASGNRAGRVFSGISRFPRHFIPALPHRLTSPRCPNLFTHSPHITKAGKNKEGGLAGPRGHDHIRPAVAGTGPSSLARRILPAAHTPTQHPSSSSPPPPYVVAHGSSDTLRFQLQREDNLTTVYSCAALQCDNSCKAYVHFSPVYYEVRKYFSYFSPTLTTSVKTNVRRSCNVLDARRSRQGSDWLMLDATVATLYCETRIRNSAPSRLASARPGWRLTRPVSRIHGRGRVACVCGWHSTQQGFSGPIVFCFVFNVLLGQTLISGCGHKACIEEGKSSNASHHCHTHMARIAIKMKTRRVTAYDLCYGLQSVHVPPAVNSLHLYVLEDDHFEIPNYSVSVGDPYANVSQNESCPFTSTLPPATHEDADAIFQTPVLPVPASTIVDKLHSKDIYDQNNTRKPSQPHKASSFPEVCLKLTAVYRLVYEWNDSKFLRTELAISWFGTQLQTRLNLCACQCDMEPKFQFFFLHPAKTILDQRAAAKDGCHSRDRPSTCVCVCVRAQVHVWGNPKSRSGQHGQGPAAAQVGPAVCGREDPGLLGVKGARPTRSARLPPQWTADRGQLRHRGTGVSPPPGLFGRSALPWNTAIAP
ncbi:hypothetical protein PR048_017397 [Dryococelus australis]|uniref:Uncharacterized protein n=1 Tax=Dryococelus australis TaxID=614101 RepID=A0ABQ9H9E5_9NEOP|nr:hypothetical protein PR048_017397 [Dryococelus australis]